MHGIFQIKEYFRQMDGGAYDYNRYKASIKNKLMSHFYFLNYFFYRNVLLACGKGCGFTGWSCISHQKRENKWKAKLLTNTIALNSERLALIFYRSFVFLLFHQLFGDWESHLRRIMKLLAGGGLSITGSHHMCGDYLYSGHTVILTLTYLFIKECKFITVHVQFPVG